MNGLSTRKSGGFHENGQSVHEIEKITGRTEQLSYGEEGTAFLQDLILHVKSIFHSSRGESRRIELFSTSDPASIVILATRRKVLDPHNFESFDGIDKYTSAIV